MHASKYLVCSSFSSYAMHKLRLVEHIGRLPNKSRRYLQHVSASPEVAICEIRRFQPLSSNNKNLKQTINLKINSFLKCNISIEIFKYSRNIVITIFKMLFFHLLIFAYVSNNSCNARLYDVLKVI